MFFQVKNSIAAVLSIRKALRSTIHQQNTNNRQSQDDIPDDGVAFEDNIFARFCSSFQFFLG